MSNSTIYHIEEVLTYFNENGESETLKHFNISAETLRRYERKKKFWQTKQPKVGILDIETSPMQVNVWGTWKQRIGYEQVINDWFMLSYSWKWLFDSKVVGSVLTPEEAINRDDKRLCLELWKLLDQCDVVIGHNCVEINTLILKQDLSWVKAGDLRVGDKLVGFEEKRIPSEVSRRKHKWIGVNGKERKVLPTTITDFAIEKQHCFRITFDNGDFVETTDNHYWLGMAESDRNQRWYKTDSLRVGQRINKFSDVWNIDNSYEAGWLSGFISGEGTLKQSSKGSVSSLDFCQRPGVTLDQAVDYCNKLNIPISSLYEKKGGLGRGDTLYAYTLGGKWKTIEILGRLQIRRFIDKINWSKFGGLNGMQSDNSPRRTSVIVKIEDVGIKSVAVFSTTEKTYIANGYPMHNCDKFDIPKAQTRFIINNLAPPSPYRTIDTLKIAQQNFRFASNKLDYIGELLLHDRKIHTEYQLWLDCMQGVPERLQEMLTYNKKDVLLEEEAYVFLRPYIKSHPNMAIYQEAVEPTCPTCGSTNIDECGHYTTSVNRYLAFRCKDCGAICRSRKIDTPLKCQSSIMMPTAR